MPRQRVKLPSVALKLPRRLAERRAARANAGQIQRHGSLEPSSQAAVLSAIPHRPPFLFIDEVQLREPNRIVCRRTFAADEGFFAGHFPDFPLVPGVILCEAAMQAGAILLAERAADGGKRVPVATRLNNVRFKQMVRPGDAIEIDVTLDDEVSGAYFLTAKVTCGGKLAVRLEFACTLADPGNQG